MRPLSPPLRCAPHARGRVRARPETCSAFITSLCLLSSAARCERSSPCKACSAASVDEAAASLRLLSPRGAFASPRPVAPAARSCKRRARDRTTTPTRRRGPRRRDKRGSIFVCGVPPLMASRCASKPAAPARAVACCDVGAALTPPPTTSPAASRALANREHLMTALPDLLIACSARACSRRESQPAPRKGARCCSRDYCYVNCGNCTDATLKKSSLSFFQRHAKSFVLCASPLEH